MSVSAVTMPGEATAPSPSQALRRNAVLIGLYTCAFVAWVLARPAPHSTVVLVDNVAQSVGPLLVLPLCFGPLFTRRGARMPRAHRWAAVLLGLSSLSFALGQGIWTYNEFHGHVPSPSWADAGYMAMYPFWTLAIFMLPSRPLPLSTRVRVLVDALLSMTAAVTFSWYFVLGPTLLTPGASLLSKVINTAYPLWDLVLLFGLILLAANRAETGLRPAVRLISLALVVTIASDVIYDLQNLNDTYGTGTLLDLGWPLGCMLLGLGAQALGLAPGPSGAPANAMEDERAGTARDERAGTARGERTDTARVQSLLFTLLPAALVPAVGALVVAVRREDGDPRLVAGVVLGGAVIVVLVVLRQVLALLENRALYGQLQGTFRRLDEAYGALEARNQETQRFAERTEALNKELHAMQRSLEANYQALKTANARLAALATSDALTSLPNHRALVAILDHELERTRRYGRHCGLLFIDLDHFKAINDGYGHAVGDTVLGELAVLVRDSLRGIDVLGRWGGEEFLAILPETDGETALGVAERIRAAVAQHAFAVGGGTRLTCSIGVATFPDTADERDALVDAADRAMYAAKRLGRNQVRSLSDPALLATDETSGAAGSREEAALVGTVEALGALVEAREQHTSPHSIRVSELTRRLALALGLDGAEARMIGLAGQLHDVGTIAVPDTVLHKPGQLTDEEWGLMKEHPIAGAEVISRVPALRAIAQLIRAHHERWDGRGYPDGLSGEAIPLGARIVAVADAYVAMITERPYRTTRTPEQALDELQRCAGSQFDPAVVAALVHVTANDPALCDPILVA